MATHRNVLFKNNRVRPVELLSKKRNGEILVMSMLFKLNY